MNRIPKQELDYYNGQVALIVQDDAALQRLEQASDAELDLWLERVLFAESLEEVFAA